MPAGIDVRFYCAKPDLSELPQAYKLESVDVAGR
jgi:tRNA-splicing ligase RtcB (3'-phosphate/5'-hydroxy nucleic acid ligase)